MNHITKKPATKYSCLAGCILRILRTMVRRTKTVQRETHVPSSKGGCFQLCSLHFLKLMVELEEIQRFNAKRHVQGTSKEMEALLLEQKRET